VEAVYQRFDGFVVMEDVEIVEQSDFLACISAQGPRATEAWVRQSTGEGAFIVPADHTGSGGFDLYVKADEALDLWKRLMEAGGKPVGEDALDILRIEAGFPAYGKELDETIIPLEANLEETHISHTKGCYVGQEIIARIHSRGHTNRALTGLLVDGSQLPRKGDKIVPVSDDTGKPAGWVTSACQSPALRRVIALAFVRHEHRAPGTALRILRGDGAITAEAAELPFVRPDAA
jgi:folate-binding protein YgfZ